MFVDAEFSTNHPENSVEISAVLGSTTCKISGSQIPRRSRVHDSQHITFLHTVQKTVPRHYYSAQL